MKLLTSRKRRRTKQLKTTVKHEDTGTELMVEGLTQGQKKRKASSESEIRKKRVKVRSSFSVSPSALSKDELYNVTYKAKTSRAEFESNYQELFLLGSGGFGSVVAGIRLQDSLPVAIKHIPKDKVFYKKVVQNGVAYDILDEVALMLKAAEGPRSAVVPLLDCFELPEEVILVMERPHPAVDLCHYKKAKGGVLEEAEAKIILKQMVHASIHMHRNGVFHRDLKCENILIETKNDAPKVRVIDFGCGCLVKEGTYDYYAGTFTKAPAEWFSCKEYKAESTTVWHLGTLLYDILHERSFNTHLYLKRKRRFNVGLSYECLDFLKVCLSRDPERRPTFTQLKCHPWLH